MKKIALSLIAIAAMAAASHAVPILYSTGYGLNAGDIDTNYILEGEQSEVSLVQYSGSLIGPGNPWIDNQSGAQWISPWVPETDLNPWISDQQGSIYGEGHVYHFVTYVGGTGTATFTGVFASDNPGEIWVNDVYTGWSSLNNPEWTASYHGLAPFTLTLTAGDKVDFRVLNVNEGQPDGPVEGGSGTGNPAGLMVSINSVPDGGLTGIMLGMGMFGMGYLRRKLKK